ncbi:signal peptidase I [Solidesulfovibrio fructosivorans JJ]]|uniref:Signal peptidase I n=1 Tax=Solidesulfovibrio fructosivorans JJ] TaxID=596151 RepID=E1JYR6_SOLFR|nr:signal peptidase I [Solidesulfovibrio fructosivorans]EFL50486.1 signal peptidase I [Solidesulfovibrio fructosivorans JJ]]
MDNKPIEKPRKPLLATTLSLAAPGLGQIYCGRFARGMVFFFCSFAFGPLLVATASHAPSTTALMAAIASIFLVLVLFVYAAVDAYLLARKTAPDYRLKEYNKWYIYAFFIAFSIFYPVSLTSVIKQEVIQAYKIPSNNMAPNIVRGDYVLLNKITYKQQQPKKGDIIVFSYPNDRRLDYIKRIVAMPGDTIEIRDNIVSINGTPLSDAANRSPGASPDDGTILTETNGGIAYAIRVADQGPGRDYPKTIVPPGHCFVLGDNRAHSHDSREFGPIPLADVKGRVEYIYYPAGDWKRFGRIAR